MEGQTRSLFFWVMVLDSSLKTWSLAFLQEAKPHLCFRAHIYWPALLTPTFCLITMQRKLEMTEHHTPVGTTYLKEHPLRWWTYFLSVLPVILSKKFTSGVSDCCFPNWKENGNTYLMFPGFWCESEEGEKHSTLNATMRLAFYRYHFTASVCNLWGECLVTAT